MTSAVRTSAVAAAPATVANVAVGFDVLGFAVPVAHDRVHVRANALGDRDVRIERIDMPGVDLPKDPEKNTAGLALLTMVRELDLPFGFTLEIDKGIPLSSGLGGSAASAVGAVVAAAALLDTPIDRQQLCRFAIAGECAASGTPHGDNVAASLFGGLVLVLAADDIVPLPVPDGLQVSVVHPSLRVDTREARARMDDRVPLHLHTTQSARFAGFVHACHRGDLDLIARVLRDDLVEPQRASLIHGFDAVKRAGIDAGALGLSISGGGPTLFAFSSSPETGQRVTAAMREAFAAADIEARGWTTPIDAGGAVVEQVA